MLSSETCSPANTALDYFGFAGFRCGKDPVFVRSCFTGNFVCSFASSFFIFIGIVYSPAPWNFYYLEGDALDDLNGVVSFLGLWTFSEILSNGKFPNL